MNPLMQDIPQLIPFHEYRPARFSRVLGQPCTRSALGVGDAEATGSAEAGGSASSVGVAEQAARNRSIDSKVRLIAGVPH
jgi:hypothetical protein